VHVDDPLFGPLLTKYATFPHHYRNSGGVWTDTFWTLDQKNNK